MDVLLDRLPVPLEGAGAVRRAFARRCRSSAGAAGGPRPRSRSGHAARTTRREGHETPRRLPPVGPQADRRSATGACLLRSTRAGVRSGASSGCSSGSRCPGFTRAGRYELLVLLGALGLYELRADSLHFSARAGRPRIRRRWPPSACSRSAIRCCSTAAPRRSPRRLAVPVGSLELALANWGTGERATLGFPPGRRRRGDARARSRRSRSLIQRKIAQEHGFAIVPRRLGSTRARESAVHTGRLQSIWSVVSNRPGSRDATLLHRASGRNPSDRRVGRPRGAPPARRRGRARVGGRHPRARSCRSTTPRRSPISTRTTCTCSPPGTPRWRSASRSPTPTSSSACSRASARTGARR